MGTFLCRQFGEHCFLDPGRFCRIRSPDCLAPSHRPRREFRLDNVHEFQAQQQRLGIKIAVIEKLPRSCKCRTDSAPRMQGLILPSVFSGIICSRKFGGQDIIFCSICSSHRSRLFHAAFVILICPVVTSHLSRPRTRVGSREPLYNCRRTTWCAYMCISRHA